MSEELLEVELEDQQIGKVTLSEDGLAVQFRRDYTGIDQTWLLRRCEELTIATPLAFERASTEFGKQDPASSMPDQSTSLVREAARVRLSSLSRSLHS